MFVRFCSTVVLDKNYYCYFHLYLCTKKSKLLLFSPSFMHQKEPISKLISFLHWYKISFNKKDAIFFSDVFNYWKNNCLWSIIFDAMSFSNIFFSPKVRPFFFNSQKNPNTSMQWHNEAVMNCKSVAKAILYYHVWSF